MMLPSKKRADLKYRSIKVRSINCVKKFWATFQMVVEAGSRQRVRGTLEELGHSCIPIVVLKTPRSSQKGVETNIETTDLNRYTTKPLDVLSKVMNNEIKLP